MKKIVSLFLVLISINLSAQRTSINYESNGKSTLIESENPFSKFFGEWTLKNNDWTQNWGGETETIKIPKHHTISQGINTKNSLLSIIDGPEPNGHIFWSYNPKTKEVFHLSSFGDIRAGHGKGTIDDEGNVKLNLSFEGEPKGTYRIYNYTWMNDDQYYMKSVQYDKNDKPTGLFYEGNFVRIETNESLRKEIDDILDILDNNEISKEQQLKVYTKNVVHMAPNNEVIVGKADLLTYLKQQKTYGYADMEHQIKEFSTHGDIVVMRGEIKGTFYPNNKKQITFKTKNLFIFKRVNKVLKIEKIIYNSTPNN